MSTIANILHIRQRIFHYDNVTIYCIYLLRDAILDFFRSLPRVATAILDSPPLSLSGGVSFPKVARYTFIVSLSSV